MKGWFLTSPWLQTPGRPFCEPDVRCAHWCTPAGTAVSSAQGTRLSRVRCDRQRARAARGDYCRYRRSHAIRHCALTDGSSSDFSAATSRSECVRLPESITGRTASNARAHDRLGRPEITFLRCIRW